MNRQPRGLICAVVLTLAPMAACDGWVPDSEDQKCGWVTSSPAPPEAGRTLFLVDVSGSTHPGRRGGPDYSAALRSELVAAAERGDSVSFGRFDGSAASVGWVEEDLVTDAHRSNENRQQRERRAVPDCLAQRLAGVIDAPAGIPGTDVLGPIGVGAQHLAAATGPKTIVVATDGLPTTGCADLTKAPIGVAEEIPTIVELCAQRDELPRGLNGVHLRFVGVGHPATGNPQPSSAKLAWLQRLWEKLCTRSGALACAVSTDAVKTRTTTSTDPPPLADPVVPFSPDPPGIAKTGERVIDIAAAALFDTGSAVLRTDGAALIRRVVADLRTSPGGRVEVHGHTDSRSGRAYNLKLSEDRAQTVAEALRAGGVVPGRVVGHGENGLLCPVETHPDGTADEVALQCNRRVRIVVSQPTP